MLALTTITLQVYSFLFTNICLGHLDVKGVPSPGTQNWAVRTFQEQNEIKHGQYKMPYTVWQTHS